MSGAMKTRSLLNKHGFDRVNQPKRLNDSTDKSHHVIAQYKEGNKTVTERITFGQEGVKTNQTAEQRTAFKERHAKNIARGPKSAAYWANKVKWSPSKTRRT
jgi:hypothetical protein